MTYLIFTVLFLITFGPRFWIVGNWYAHITPPELLAHRYQNQWVAVAAAVISFFMLIPYASVQLMGMGLLVEGITGSDVYCQDIPAGLVALGMGRGSHSAAFYRCQPYHKAAG